MFSIANDLEDYEFRAGILLTQWLLHEALAGADAGFSG
jgi:hypothetical protein